MIATEVRKAIKEAKYIYVFVHLNGKGGRFLRVNKTEATEMLKGIDSLADIPLASWKEGGRDVLRIGYSG